jgi:predicted Zn-dependent peptidase
LNLCNYIERRNNDNNAQIIKLVGNFKLANIIVIFKCGSIDEQIGKHGVCHLCEHIFLKLVEDAFNKEINDIDFKYMGCVDYTYTMLHFMSSSNIKCISKLIKGIIDIININNIKKDIIEESRKEILTECKIRKNNVEESLIINSFLSNEEIDFVPVGNLEQIKMLNNDDINNYFKNFIKNMNIALMLDKDVSIINIENIINKIPKNQKILTHKYDMKKDKISCESLKISSSKMENYIKVHFLIDDKVTSNVEILMEKMLEILMSDRLYKSIESLTNTDVKVSYSRKTISDKYNYIIITIKNAKNELDNSIDKIINNITIKKLSMCEYNFCVKTLEKCLTDISEVNESYIIDGVLKHILYNEILLVTSEQITDTINTLKNITYNKLEYYKRNLYNNGYKIIFNMGITNNEK